MLKAIFQILTLMNDIEKSKSIYLREFQNRKKMTSNDFFFLVFNMFKDFVFTRPVIPHNWWVQTLQKK